MLGVGELADDELHRAVAAGDDDAGARGEEVGQVLLGVEVDDQVVGEVRAELPLDLVVHAPGVAAEDEEAGGLHAARALPSRRIHRAHARE